MTARGIGGVLLALLVGVGVGVGAAYAMRPEPDSIGTPAPVPAASPDVPTDDPYAPDIRYAALGEVDEFDTYEIGNAIQTWEYAVPQGWVAYRVPSGVITPPDEIPDYDELRFRPADEPEEGGYSLRVKAVDNHKATQDEVIDRIASLERTYEEVDILEQTDEALYFTFRDDNNRLRYNFFQWFAAPGVTEATLEMSVAGRAVDEEGLRALFDQFAEQARPVED